MSRLIFRRFGPIFSLLFLLALAVDLSACGRKGPLTVPGEVVPEILEDRSG